MAKLILMGRELRRETAPGATFSGGDLYVNVNIKMKKKGKIKVYNSKGKKW